MKTVVYFILRSEKDGLNADVLFREMGERVERDPDHYVSLMDKETSKIDAVSEHISYGLERCI
jgi:hypothetical protein